MSVNETYPMSLVCSARGYPAVDITWQYQNTQLMDSDPGLSIQSVTEESINGFLNTTSTLTIQSVDRSDAGNYACNASNTVFGSPVSDMQQFMLTVKCKYLVTACTCVNITCSLTLLTLRQLFLDWYSHSVISTCTNHTKSRGVWRAGFPRKTFLSALKLLLRPNTAGNLTPVEVMK